MLGPSPTCGLTVVLLAANLLLHPPAGSAAMFECLDASGITVMTDSPSQLLRCHKLSDALPVSPEAMRQVQPIAPAREALDQPRRISAEESQDQDRHRRVTAPLRRVGPLFVVGLTVNDTRDIQLILDTGASHTILSRRLAQDLGLFDGTHATHQVTMQTVGGPVLGDVVQVDSLRLGSVEVRRSLAAIYDLPDAPPGVEGLLGLSFLRQFEITLDTIRNQLHLSSIPP